MMSGEESAVYQANENFYRAFESFNIAQMERVWLKADYIECFHPGWAMLRGWEAVMTSWRRIFENTDAMRFVLTEPRIAVRVPWRVTLPEPHEPSRRRESAAVVLTTNIFENISGLAADPHHGSPVMQPPMPDDASTVH
jgi:hypothetical protein